MGKFIKHYIAPLLKRGQTVPYDARTFFDSWYSSQQELTDAATISKLATPTFTRYHYNATENSLIEFFARRNPPRAPTVLDVGCGSGHWIRFYREVFGARRVVGVDISDAGVTALREHLKGLDAIDLLRADVSSADFRLDETFDIINAVGVMFHIVDDEAWRRAVENLAHRLEPAGVIAVGGQFGWITQNVQFHRTDEFEDWESHRQGPGEALRFNKRIRSLRAWRHCAERAGLEVLDVVRTRVPRPIRTPENNILVLGRRHH